LIVAPEICSEIIAIVLIFNIIYKNLTKKETLVFRSRVVL